MSEPRPTTLLLWGKADPARAALGPAWHPLLCHVLDVMACADELLTLRPKRLDSLAEALSLEPMAARGWLLWMVALHDLGKATPPFQGQVAERREVLRAAGFDFPDDHWSAHGELTCPLAATELQRAGLSPGLARKIARAVGGHHGVIPSIERVQTVSDGEGLLRREGGQHPFWRQAVQDIAAVTRHHAGVRPPSPVRPADHRQLHGFLADLAGLTTAADWLGSNADVFTYVDPPASTADYWQLARERAAESLAQAGWRSPPRPEPRTFEELFHKSPWPLHIATNEVAAGLTQPSLVVIEAPMGEGKTEAALSIYDRLAADQATGLYFALPTQATSNQIFGRVERYLRESFPEELHGLHLVHGDAGLSAAYDVLKDRAFRMRSIDGASAGATGPVADAWFTKSKRSLLAPMGVGTVDQALLGVLGVKHGFLRLHGLAGKVVVVDEVHAYDTYTGELLARLLAWLHCLGATVVLLSATLPRVTRERLARSYGATLGESPAYPRITVAQGGACSAVHVVPRKPPVDLELEWRDEARLVEELRAALEHGGNVAVIVNTVARAQALWTRLRRSLPPAIPVELLHARLPFAARQAREIEVEALYGPASTRRPWASVLVGTQVLEQSLDLDFDLMVTEVAPIDLILQRAGRLHRHPRPVRPPGLERPRLWLLRPENLAAERGPTFGVSTFVYDEAILLRTWTELEARNTVQLPGDIEGLVERVYGSPCPHASEALANRLQSLEADLERQRATDSALARGVELPDPGQDGDPWNGFAEMFEDDDPRVHPRLRAVTRLGEPSVDVVPMIAEGNTLRLFGDPSTEIDPDARTPLPRQTTLRLVRQSFSISRKGVTHELIRTQVPAAFEASGHLRFHRPLLLDRDGVTSIAGVDLRLDSRLGLVIGNLDLGTDPA